MRKSLIRIIRRARKWAAMEVFDILYYLCRHRLHVTLIGTYGGFVATGVPMHPAFGVVVTMAFGMWLGYLRAENAGVIDVSLPRAVCGGIGNTIYQTPP